MKVIMYSCWVITWIFFIIMGIIHYKIYKDEKNEKTN